MREYSMSGAQQSDGSLLSLSYETATIMAKYHNFAVSLQCKVCSSWTGTRLSQQMRSRLASMLAPQTKNSISWSLSSQNWLLHVSNQSSSEILLHHVYLSIGMNVFPLSKSSILQKLWSPFFNVSMASCATSSAMIQFLKMNRFSTGSCVTI